MVKAGTKVIMKKDGRTGMIIDCWNPHSINPTLYPLGTPTGYCILLDNGKNRICMENDFALNTDRGELIEDESSDWKHDYAEDEYGITLD